MNHLALVIPAYNEEKRIGKTLEEYAKYFFKSNLSKKLKVNLYVIINATTDNTEKIVKSYSSKFPQIKYKVLLKGGKGYAVIEGFKLALLDNPEVVGYVDADLATTPEQMYSQYLMLEKHEVLVPSRYLPDSIVNPKQTFQRRLASRIFNLCIKLLFGMSFADTQCSGKLFKSSSIKKILPKVKLTQYSFDVELLYLLMKEGADIIEVPTVWSDQEYSKVNFLKAGPLMFLGLIKLRLTYSPFKGMTSILDKLIGRRL